MGIRYCLLFVAILLLSFTQEAVATHLVGGNMSYVYVGARSNGQFGYKVVVKMYRDCWASNVPFDSKIEIGVYHNNTNRDLYRAVKLNKITERTVANPYSMDSCSINTTICLKEGIYEAIMDLDSSSLGYHLVFERCCRNIMANLHQFQGQTFYTFIPPTSVANNSSLFTQVPVNYVCANDSVSFANYATDVDGDSLVFQLVMPWTGGSSMDPEPAIKTSWPAIPNFNPVVFKSGYSQTSPFGTSGYVNVNPNNGFTEAFASQQGVYTFTIEVSEYRNGQFLSRNRLDMAVFVISCPPNAIPVISTSTGSYNFEVVEGETLCFDVHASDANNDSISLSSAGTVFTGGTNFGNTATLDSKKGLGSVSSSFCWTPSCGRASAQPYTFTIAVSDNGCPKKTRLQQVTVKVNPFIHIPFVIGDTIVCRDTTAIVYSVQGTSSSTFTWLVYGGSIVNGQGTNTIRVKWGSGPSGKVSVNETVAGTCGQNRQISSMIELRPGAEFPNITGADTLCEFTTGSTYFIPPLAGYTYNWTVTGGQIAGSSAGNSIKVNWQGNGPGKVELVQTNNVGCVSDTGRVLVEIQKPMIDSVLGSTGVCPNARGVEYSIRTVNPGSKYYWSVSGGNIVSGLNTGKVTIDWGDMGPGIVDVHEVSKFQCISNPVTIPVLKNHNLQAQVPLGAVAVCEKTKGIIYTVEKSAGSNYLWTINNGTIVQGNQGNIVLVDWANAGPAELTVQELAFDSINNMACISQPATLHVLIGKEIGPAAIMGKDKVCQNEAYEAFYMSGSHGSVFEWWFTGGGGILHQGDSLIKVRLDLPGMYKLEARETSVFGCVGPISEKLVYVNPVPVTSNIAGNSITTQQYDTFYVTNTPGSYYSWNLSGGGTLIPGTTPNQTFVHWHTPSQIVSLSVTEINHLGCPGDTMYKNIYVNYALGAASIVSSSSLKAYPNPVNNVIHLTIPNAPQGNFMLQVINSLGQTVYKEQWLQSQTALDRNLDVRAFEPGIYTVMVNNGSQHYSQKIVVQR